MTTLREDWLRLINPDGKKIKVNGFTGVGTLILRGEDHIFVLAADEDVLFETVRELLPEAEISGVKFQTVTVIQAQNQP